MLNSPELPYSAAQSKSTKSGRISAYDDRTIQALASENETLKQQNNVLLASQDAYKNPFKILAASISLDLCDSDILKFAGIPPGFKSANDYPKTKFWIPSLYKAWKKSPSVQYTEHGTFPFLENTDGEPIEKSEISCITKSLRSCWAALKQENRAPNTWGKAGNKILDEVTEEMARLHLILALCENGWKVHAIATERYPSWTVSGADSGTCSAKLAERKRESTVPDPVAPSAVSASSSASTLPPSNIPAASASATVESASGKKFRPGTSKNGRSLCAHQWLKQVAANGSSADFRIYWSGLTKDKQLAYKADALKLVSDDIWNGNTVDIIGRFSSGALY
ncbi:hypothetical protein EV702DRAFT_1047660 [Suillus placidus]|uniref:Uncharacterized protein n=1 Tax=Suillus placidus TaxID=48579 RepID=A0A9P7CZC5_9AGAM|nr:hypothetical protein EV702DRAFT_1047660 [Suillus placidus]